MPTDSNERAIWIWRVLGVAIAADEDADPVVVPARAPDIAQAMAQWRKAREAALGSLSTLEMLVRASTHAQKDAAVILLRSIRANLTETPESAAQVDELARYVRDDDILRTAERPNVFGVQVALRAPLGAAIGGLRAALATREGLA